ncbi:MAG: hypothetical protein ACTSYN_02695 [Candidatus Heimdallarchaeaceae archaeon]
MILKRVNIYIRKCLIIAFATLIVFASLKAIGSNDLNSSNHNYPIPSLMVLKLNNDTKDGLQASLRIYNRTSQQWEVNKPILEVIKADLSSLTKNIEGLKQISLYDYNYSYCPGEAYLILSPESLEQTGLIANQTIDYVMGHSERWWYVADLSIEYIDLAFFDFTNFEGYAIDYIYTIYGSTLLNYTIINNTVLISYPQRNNILACLLLYNGTDWIYNYTFLDYFNKTLEALNNQPFFHSNGVVLSPFKSEMLKNAKATLEEFNVTPTLPNNYTETQLFHLLYAPTHIYMSISYSSLMSTPNKALMYFTTFRVFQRMWFTTSVDRDRRIPAGNNSVPFNFCFSIPAVIVIVLLIKHQTKKRKLQCLYP